MKWLSSILLTITCLLIVWIVLLYKTQTVKFIHVVHFEVEYSPKVGNLDSFPNHMRELVGMPRELPLNEKTKWQYYENFKKALRKLKDNRSH